MKKTIVLAALMAALGVGLSLWLVASLDDLLRQGIESLGSRALQTRVTVDRVHLSASDGAGEIGGLRIANPAGFAAANALEAGQITLRLDAASLTEPVLRVREISLGDTRVNVEDGDRGRNLDILKQNVESLTGKQAPTPAADARKMIIDRIVLRGIALTYTGKLTLGQPLQLTLPDVVVRDVGAKSGGVTAEQLTRVLLDALTRQVTSSLASQLKGAAENAVGSGLKSLFGR